MTTNWITGVLEVFMKYEGAVCVTVQAKGEFVEVWLERGRVAKMSGCEPDMFVELIQDPKAVVQIRSVSDTAPVSTIDWPLLELTERASRKVVAGINALKRQTLKVSLPERKKNEEKAKAVIRTQVTEAVKNGEEKREDSSAIRKAIMFLELDLEKKEHFWIGRDESCDLPLDDTSVSRFHCHLISHENVFYLQDYNSTNGCAVNGQKADYCVVREGDLLQLGNVMMLVKFKKKENGAESNVVRVQRGIFQST